MNDEQAIFLFVTAANTAHRIPELIGALVAQDFRVYSVVTPNVAQVIAPETLMNMDGNYWIQDYRQEPLDRYPFGTLVVAPCTFNTFNKLALGLADNLATSMIADGLGAERPTLIAPSMNAGLWAHPQRRLSQERLESWGCEIVLPNMSSGRVTLAPTETIVKAVMRRTRFTCGNDAPSKSAGLI